MKLQELKALLRQHADKRVGVRLPDGEAIEPDFHVTEVGHVAKTFIDCGGKRRSTEACVLQTWVALADKEHRLYAGKLAHILDLSDAFMPSQEISVEIEYESCVISQYPLAGFAIVGDEVQLQLTTKHTDCLARELCGVQPAGSAASDGAGACGGDSGCC